MMSAVSRSSSSRPEYAAASNDAVRARGKPGARTLSTRIEHGRCRLGDARGLEVSPCGLGQDHLVQGQIGNGAAQPGVLRLQLLLHPLHLIRLQPAELLAPAIVSHLGHADRSHGVSNRLSLRSQHISLSQLGDDLLRLMTLSWHCDPPSVCQKTYPKVDQFIGVDQNLGCLRSCAARRKSFKELRALQR